MNATYHWNVKTIRVTGLLQKYPRIMSSRWVTDDHTACGAGAPLGVLPRQLQKLPLREPRDAKLLGKQVGIDHNARGFRQVYHV